MAHIKSIATYKSATVNSYINESGRVMRKNKAGTGVLSSCK